MLHRKIIIPLLLILSGAPVVSRAQGNNLAVWKIGFAEGKKEVSDSSAHKIRYEYPRLYCSGPLTLAAHLSGEEKHLLEARLEEIQELLWEGGIPGENIRIADIGQDIELKVMKLKTNTCYLIFVSKDPAHVRMLGLQNPVSRSSDTVISAGESCYLRYNRVDYHFKTGLPEIRMLNHDAQTKDELGLYEKVNTRGFNRELAFFQLTKNDSDHIVDQLVFPLDAQSMKSSMRLDRYDKEHRA